MPRLAIEKWEQEHRKHIKEFLAEIDSMYHASTEELVRLGAAYLYTPEKGRLFSYASDKARSARASQQLKEMHSKLLGIIQAGVATEWAFANEKADSWVRTLFSDPKRGYMMHNLEALESFLHREIYGHTLSQHIWRYTKQFKTQIELALSVGLSEGRSAEQISQDVRQYLREPNRLFRRVRDRFGELVLSKASRAYHPGKGVYRSSYQNALRMARTEINGAYRQADYERWQQLDFIVGIEIKTSKSHAAWLARAWYPRFKKGKAPLEICDALEGRYPKDFKFIGWHPNCKCYAVPILANEGTKRDWWEEPTNRVETIPDGLREWMAQNAKRIERATARGTTPYWIKENKKTFAV